MTVVNEAIARELDAARQRLLDLTLRNRLLNYRPNALRSIRVVGELPAEIYDALVLREKALELRGAKKTSSFCGASSPRRATS